MKLEKKHIIPYLPYDLEVMDLAIDKPFNASEWVLKHHEPDDLFTSNLDQLLNDDLLKPILRPLSDLIKPIEHNGKKVVPVKEICREFDYDDNSPWSMIDLIENQCFDEMLPFVIVEKLIEWKFDIYGLIDNGLAIDKNTLK